jgi:predicted nicotinamide N-methyase
LRQRLAVWTRVAAAWSELRRLKVVRFGDNMRQVAVTEGDVVGSACRWDMILAGDVCYEAPMTAHILPWLRAMAAVCDVWVADPGRAYLPGQGLDPLARHAVPTSREVEDRELREVTIYRMAP